MKMKVIVSTDAGNVAEHFGRCPEFTIAEIEDEKIIKKELIKNPGHSTGFLPDFFAKKGARIVIAGGAGFRAQELFKEKGIELILGFRGTVNDALDLFAGGKLEGKEGFCSPGLGKGYGIKKEDGNEK